MQLISLTKSEPVSLGVPHFCLDSEFADEDGEKVEKDDLHKMKLID